MHVKIIVTCIAHVTGVTARYVTCILLHVSNISCLMHVKKVYTLSMSYRYSF